MLAGLKAHTTAAWAARQGNEAVLTSAPLTLTAPDEATIGTGQLALFPDRLALLSEDGEVWQTALSEIDNINVEFQRALEFRCKERLLRAVLPTGSAWRWPWSVRWWAER